MPPRLTAVPSCVAGREVPTWEDFYIAVGTKPDREIGVTFVRGERPDPGVELLCGKLLFEATEACFPDSLHGRILPVSSQVIHRFG